MKCLAGTARRSLLLVLAALLLTGCVSFSTFYNRLDWAGSLYAQSWVSLNRSQRASLRHELAELHDWHCATQVTGYADRLAQVEIDLQAHALTYARVAAHYDAASAAWRTVRERAGPRATTFLLELRPAQVEQLFAELEKENVAFDPFVDPSKDSAEREYVQRMEKQVSEWIGPMTPGQRQAVADWGRRVWPSSGARLQARRAYQHDLKQALQAHDAPRVQRLLVEPDMNASAEARAAGRRYREELVALLSEIGALLTPPQRERLIARARGWRNEFQRMACTERGPLRAGPAGSEFPATDG